MEGRRDGSCERAHMPPAQGPRPREAHSPEMRGPGRAGSSPAPATSLVGSPPAHSWPPLRPGLGSAEGQSSRRLQPRVPWTNRRCLGPVGMGFRQNTLLSKLLGWVTPRPPGPRAGRRHQRSPLPRARAAKGQRGLHTAQGPARLPPSGGRAGVRSARRRAGNESAQPAAGRPQQQHARQVPPSQRLRAGWGGHTGRRALSRASH